MQMEPDRVMDKKERLDSEYDSRRQRFLKAREFKCLSKELYVITKVRFGLLLLG